MRNQKSVSVLLFFIGILFLFNTTSCSNGTTVADQTTDFEVQAGDIFQAFLKNETDSNQKYVGKILEVVGTIKKVKTTSNGTMDILLDVNNSGSVVCNFPKENNSIASKVQAGGIVKIKGICSGYLLNVMMDDCILIHVYSHS